MNMHATLRKSMYFCLAIAVTAMLSAVSATAGTVTYTAPASFDAATSGLSTQTFGFLAGTVGPGGGVNVDNPLNSATNNGYVVPGNILAGLTIAATTNNGFDIALIGPGFAGPGSPANYSVFSSYFAGLLFTLSPGQTAFSMGVLSLFRSSNATISVYSPSSALLGTFNLAGVPNTGGGEFWGVTTNGGDTIGSVLLTVDGGQAPGVDQIQFGNGTPISEPGSLVLVGTSLFGLAGLIRRKVLV